MQDFRSPQPFNRRDRGTGRNAAQRCRWVAVPGGGEITPDRDLYPTRVGRAARENLMVTSPDSVIYPQTLWRARPGPERLLRQRWCAAPSVAGADAQSGAAGECPHWGRSRQPSLFIGDSTTSGAGAGTGGSMQSRGFPRRSSPPAGVRAQFHVCGHERTFWGSQERQRAGDLCHLRHADGIRQPDGICRRGTLARTSSGSRAITAASQPSRSRQPPVSTRSRSTIAAAGQGVQNRRLMAAHRWSHEHGDRRLVSPAPALFRPGRTRSTPMRRIMALCSLAASCRPFRPPPAIDVIRCRLVWRYRRNVNGAGSFRPSDRTRAMAPDCTQSSIDTINDSWPERVLATATDQSRSDHHGRAGKRRCSADDRCAVWHGCRHKRHARPICLAGS